MSALKHHLYCRCQDPTVFVAGRCRTCGRESEIIHDPNLPNIIRQPPTKRARTDTDKGKERVPPPEIEESEDLPSLGLFEPRREGAEPIWTGPFHAREQYSRRYGFHPLSSDYVRLTGYTTASLVDTSGFSERWHPQIWPVHTFEAEHHIRAWTAWVDQNATSELAQKFGQYFGNRLWNLMVEGCLDGRRYNRNCHAFGLRIEAFVNGVACGVRVLCCGLQRIRHSIEDMSDADMTKICMEVDQVFSYYHDQFRSAWTRIADPTISLGEVSVLELIEAEDWYREVFPAGLKCTVPSDRPVSTCIKRFLWPVDFERIVATWPPHLSALPPYDTQQEAEPSSHASNENSA